MVHRDGRGAEERGEIMQVLESRFAQHPERHPDIDWDDVLARLETLPGKLRVLQGMENTGGEPDVVDVDERTGGLVFFDCSPESPIGRRTMRPLLRASGTSRAAAPWAKPSGWASSF